MILADTTSLIVPGAEILYSYGADSLKHLAACKGVMKVTVIRIR